MDSISHYMPHGHCYLWQTDLIAAHTISDTLIGLSYLAISVTLYLLIRKIKMPFSPIVLAFGVFIGACGLTHFLEVWNLWHANYWIGAEVKILTAIASVCTCLALIHLSPKILAFAEAAKLSEERGIKLKGAYDEMEMRVLERTRELEVANTSERVAKEQAEKLYGEAQKANRLKDEFLATMSHELRTPLSVILGYSELLVGDDLLAEEREQALATIHRNAQMQFQLVNDLLDVSMIISGKMQLNAKIVELKESVEAAIESVSLAAKAKSILLSTNFSKEPLPVYADATRIQQMVWNLISNAIKFTDKHGSVGISLYADNSRCKIEVADSGMGIDPAFLPHVFERFRQEDSSSSRKFGGLGLGLGIVRHLTELHGGTVEVTSEGKGKGAKFCISLPIAPFVESQEAIEQIAVSIELNKSFKAKRVLIIDDEPDVRQLIQTFLHKQEMITKTASSSEEALTLVTEFNPDVIVCDIGMPTTDGYTLIRMIRDQEIIRGQFTPAIALTAYAQEGTKQKALAAGFQSFLTKPAQFENLLMAIAQVILP